MTFVQSITVSINKYKHCAPQRWHPPGLIIALVNRGGRILHLTRRAPILSSRIGLFHTLQQTVKSNPEMEAFCCPKHPGNFTVLSYWMPLTPQKWGLFSFDNCPWFSQAPGICITMAAASCMNNISRMWLCRYPSRWFQFTLQLLQGAFIWYLNSTGDGWLLQDP